jgi:hypothetical protein
MAGGASNLRDALLPAVDVIRGIPAQLGQRLYTVSIRVQQWTGPRPGVGSVTTTDTGLKVDLGLYPVKIRQLSQREIIASAGLYEDNDIEIGPITPPYAGSTADNDAISVWLPNVIATAAAEIRFRILGPGYPASGVWHRMISHDFTQRYRYMFVLRGTADVGP